MRRLPGGALLADPALVPSTNARRAASHNALASRSALTAPADPYTWRNVRIDGGGFVPGIVFNPGEQSLIYVRTDIGGACRWNESAQSWTPLLDWVGQDDSGHHGVLSIAPDPVDTKRVHAVVGVTRSRVGTATQSGAAVTVVNAGYRGALTSGASTTFGFLGSTTSTSTSSNNSTSSTNSTRTTTTNPVPSPITCSTTP
ncbi:cellulose binding domain-containing protein [Actinoplanes missouriensis]|uniref:cellulose binding domain-containing protein n=1 Tax=Actinoplanes missouriensis TaxID=1866 RepID=UPI0033F04177